MAKITDIYKQYKIMPILQLHQLRVTAVAKQICDSFDQPINSQAVITACLLHDMANIIKFDLTQFPEAVQPQGRDYWEGVKADFIKRWGPDEHVASVAIAQEIGVSALVLDCIESVDFGLAVKNAKRKEFEPKICDNADLRVNPHGVVSIQERLEDGAKRYKNRPDKWIPEDGRNELLSACYKVEKQIFAHTSIKPQDITDESIAPLIEQLRSYEI